MFYFDHQEEASVEVFTLTGLKVEASMEKEDGVGKIDLGAFDNGVYLVKFITNGTIVTNKVLVNH